MPKCRMIFSVDVAETNDAPGQAGKKPTHTNTQTNLKPPHTNAVPTHTFGFERHALAERHGPNRTAMVARLHSTAVQRARLNRRRDFSSDRRMYGVGEKLCVRMMMAMATYTHGWRSDRQGLVCGDGIRVV